MSNIDYLSAKAGDTFGPRPGNIKKVSHWLPEGVEHILVSHAGELVVDIEKLYGPSGTDAVRVRLDYGPTGKAFDWVIEQDENGHMVEMARFPAQRPDR